MLRSLFAQGPTVPEEEGPHDLHVRLLHLKPWPKPGTKPLVRPVMFWPWVCLPLAASFQVLDVPWWR